MTASEIAKSYGAKTLKEVAEHHGKLPQNLIKVFHRNKEEFEQLCWQWAKAKSPHADQLRRAFIDGALATGLPDGNASNLATMKGYMG